MSNSELNSNILELAKQGNPKAVADLLNGQLQPKGITAIVTKDKYFDKEERLKIVFEFEQAKSKEKILIFTQKFFQKISPQSIGRVMVYGRRKGNDASDWSGEIKLNNTNELADQVNFASKVFEDVEQKSKVTSDEIKIDSETDIVNDSLQSNILAHGIMLKLKNAYDLFTSDNVEGAKSAIEDFLSCVARLDNELNWDKREQAEHLMHALYIKAVCNACLESVQSALIVLYSALKISDRYTSPELEFTSEINDLINSLEGIEDKNTTIAYTSPSLVEESHQDSDEEIGSSRETTHKNDASLENSGIGVGWIPSGIALVLYLPLFLLLLVPVLFFGVILISNPVGWVIIVLLVIYFIGQTNS